MASLSRQANGRRTVQFIGADGKRRSIRLGKMGQRQADAVKVRIEQLVAAKVAGHPIDDDTARWLSSVDDVLLQKLANAGLVNHRASTNLIEFIDAYIIRRKDAKPSTATVWRRSRNHLQRYFGNQKAVRDITVGDAKDFRRYLKDRSLAEDTVRRTCGITKQFFADAVDRGLIQKNPFKHRDIPTATGAGDKSREFFVSRELAEKVIEALPDAQWRLMFALARFGGLRCPSEVLSLRWGDIDWDRNRIVITSPKTEHHVGGASRVIPLFPELRQYLDECFQIADEGAEYCVSRYRKFDSNYSVLLNKLVKRAGLPTWPKPWHNLRSSRETELVEQYPQHVVCKWIGNSQVVAEKHYLQVTDEHFEKAVQKAVQQPAEMRRKASQPRPMRKENTVDFPSIAAMCDLLPFLRVGVTGLEPVTSSV